MAKNKKWSESKQKPVNYPYSYVGMKVYKTKYAKSKFDLKKMAKLFREKGYDAIVFPNGELMKI